jgi:hypothetical protein
MVNFQSGQGLELWLPDLLCYCGPLTADLVKCLSTATGTYWSMMLRQLIAVFSFTFGPKVKVRVDPVEGLRDCKVNVLLWTCTVACPGSGMCSPAFSLLSLML